MKNNKLRTIIKEMINEENFDIPQHYQDFDDFEFHGAAKNAAMADIGNDFEEIGHNKFEKGMNQKDFAQKVTKANLKLDDYEKEIKKLQKDLDFKKQGEDKLKGVANKMRTSPLSMNEEKETEEYDFDTTNLYKFLKDALYTLIYGLEETGLNYAEIAKILEKELNKNFDIKKK